MRVITTSILVLLLFAGGAIADDFDLAAGEKSYKKCGTCHAVGPEAKNKAGPELNGIVGRPVASVEGYKYSNGEGSLTEWGAGKTWTVEILEDYLTKPKDVVPKTKMSFSGFKKEDEVTNVIAYLAQFDLTGAKVDPVEVMNANKGE